MSEKTECFSSEQFAIIDGSEEKFGEINGSPYVEKKARIFYKGVHRGKPYGDKEINAMVSLFQEPASDVDWSVPIQANHTDSSWDTLGNVRGVCREGDEVHGILRFIGEDNVTRAKDGRFKKVSVRIGLPSCRLKEVSVTPFPELEKAATFKEGDDKKTMSDEKVNAEKEAAMAELKAKAEAQEAKFAQVQAEYEAKLTAQTEAAKALEVKLSEVEKTLKMAEVKNQMEALFTEGKVTSATIEKETALYMSFSDEQKALYHEVKKLSPAYVTFGKVASVRADKPGAATPADARKEADEMLSDLGYKKNTEGTFVKA